MSLQAYDLSADLFVRGLTNLRAMLDAAAASGGDEAALLGARLGAAGPPADLHGYTLAAQVHWAAEGALLAIALLRDVPRTPAQPDATTFAELDARLEAAIAELRAAPADELEAGLARTITITRRGGSVSAPGDRFLTAFAIPHFHYHLASAYGILRNQGVPLTMGAFLGDWGAG